MGRRPGVMQGYPSGDGFRHHRVGDGSELVEGKALLVESRDIVASSLAVDAPNSGRSRPSRLVAV